MSKFDNPKVLIHDMRESFCKAAESLIVKNKDELCDYEGALYGYIYAKPTKRLSTTLSIDREILVLFVSFDDLQARTIGAAKKLIDESLGRLENTFVIIVHKDQGGNSKLKNWGRQQGLSVLPVYIDRELPTGDPFERMLCNELYSHDPFDITGPVSDDAHFFGRRTEALDLARKLQAGQIRTTLGIRKIGKTSIINRIVNEVQKNYKSLNLMIDCSRDEVWSLSAGQLLMSISDSINNALRSSLNYISLECNESLCNIRESAKELLKSILSVDCPVIIYFDEIDYITPGSPTNKQWIDEFNVFWRNFRAIYQEITRSSGVLSLMICGVSSKWFTVESISGVENSALSLIPEEYLSPLARGASVAMIKKVGRTAGLIFEEGSANQIAAFCSDMPYWIRKACSYINRNIEIKIRPTTPDAEKTKVLLDSFVKNEGAAIAQVALAHLFKVYPELEVAFYRCSVCDHQNVSSYIKHKLVKYGLVNEGASFVPSGEMIRVGYVNYMEYKELNCQGDECKNIQEGISSQEIGEWADEIALVAKRRNVLEKRIRSIALNFVRMDTLQHKEKKNSKDRLLAVLESSRRDVYSHLSAEEVIEKYCWLDLVKLLSTKEWSLFEKLIGDKNQFTLSCNIINDRPDAHAKNYDQIEFALYRRSLSYIEEIFRKIE